MKMTSSRQEKLSPPCIPVPCNVNRINHRQSLLVFLGYFFPKGVKSVVVAVGVKGVQSLLQLWPPVSSCPHIFFFIRREYNLLYFLFLYSKRIQMSDQFILPHSLFVIVDLNVLVLLTILHSLSYLKSIYVSAFSFCSAKAAWFGFSGESSIFIDIKNTHLIANLKVD